MRTPRAAHIAAVSLNQTVGDWLGNTERIRDAIQEARTRGARLVLTPELGISGYSLGDRVLRRGTLDRSWAALEALIPETRGLVAMIGLPIRHRGVLYNAVAVCADGRLVGLCAKENLATGDVEYENRWYAGWPRGVVEDFHLADGRIVPIGSLVFEAQGLGRFAVEVCEDAWKGLRPGSIYALAGATLIVNPSATWFVLGKQAMRRRMITQISDEDVAVYLFASLLGCDDTRLIFDGSLLCAQQGSILGEGPRFQFGERFVVLDRVIDLDAVAQRRMAMGSWRQQVEALYRGEFGPVPKTVEIPGDYSSPEAAPAVYPYWLRGTEPIHVDASLQWLVDEGLVPQIEPADVPHLELELALCLALREYLRKTGIRGVTLALSGGRDSSMIAVLVHRMHRYDRPSLSADELRAHVAKHFVTVWMETDNSSENTRRAARLVAEECGARHFASSIQDLNDAYVKKTEEMLSIDLDWSNPAHDLPLQNIQARVRGALAWFVANLHGFLLVTTSNLSEAAVGYATMDGDTAGGLAPIANVPKSLVSLWLDWAARFHGYASLQAVFEKPPSAELRPGATQTDEDDLMPFFVLDQLMHGFVQKGQDPLDLFEALWPSLSQRYNGDAAAFAAHIRRFVTKMCQAQWKRERFAISFRVTAFDLDPKTGFRFPPVQAPFTEELAALDAHVASLPRQ